MTAILGKVAFNILYGDRKKKIAQFLRTTTPESVLSDLHACLVREGVSSITPQAVFDASSIRDSPQGQPYWTKKSFQNHLARTHPDTTFPDIAIDVLWSCFCFYAYHPFPLPDAGDKKLDLSAFERGLILLALQGTKLLGLVDDGFGHCWWRNEEPCNCKLRLNRIFRSISLVVDRQSTSDSPVAGFDPSITDDVIDAILPTFPAHPKLHPSLEQLKPLAERLREERRTDQLPIKANDLAALLCLLLRLRVHKSTWSRDFHYGSFEESSSEKEELANILARSFCLGQDEDLAPESVLRALDFLPNLEQLFHQLWSTLFQPGTPTEIPNVETDSSPDTMMDGILRAVSLFIPSFQTHKRTELARKVQLITFHKFYDSISQSLTDSLDLDHIFQPIVHKDSDQDQSHLVLFLGNQAPDLKEVVVGAFFPSGTLTPAVAKEAKKLATINTARRIPLPQLLFQLKPSFSLFRLNKESSSYSSSQADDSATEHSIDHLTCIGEPNRSKVGLELDPVTRQATFLRGTATAANRMPGAYEEVARKHGDGADTVDGDQQERRTAFTVTRVAIFNVEGGPKYDNPW
ncbi:uncharacterized protein BO97DRAFT_467494 [Aspergillus homomorphus CBS 101889]|uniref:Uncharacterized protein n=1 Tax=Aspergillus homomorphus (strain CBS 101889) TaxID=1450537 RepID=A0A395I9Y2_ASPHC|nr:hypothetical protein BO97DRAFT_467494 [Aspergillus homomorphus CBS 101889]RAL16977.1 hypothetical protein BO97DRAFT_467494 [Aspergillus homomorphus CBS 101889]